MNRNCLIEIFDGVGVNSSDEIKSEPVFGGSINKCFKVLFQDRSYFLKTNSIENLDFFEKERLGLDLLGSQNIIKVPEVYKVGVTNDSFSYLLMEFVESKRKDNSFYGLFGKQLSSLHSVKSESYGLEFDNYLGSTIQRNHFESDWIKFFVENRLEIELKRLNGDYKHLFSLFNNLYGKLNSILKISQPSLIHGDLWNGNVMNSLDGLPTIYDPAVYFGEPEVDLAYTKLFSGFTDDFYKSYYQNKTIDKSLNERLDIYNLYPLLFHLNEFGDGYLSEITIILKRYE